MTATRLSVAAIGIALCSAWGGRTSGPAANGLVVHEWGTFTSLQDKDGNAVGGINVDDEPAPSFVHRIDPSGPPAPAASSSKGVVSGLPAVNLRLETPVLYFHAPDDKPW